MDNPFSFSDEYKKAVNDELVRLIEQKKVLLEEMRLLMKVRKSFSQDNDIVEESSMPIVQTEEEIENETRFEQALKCALSKQWAK